MRWRIPRLAVLAVLAVAPARAAERLAALPRPDHVVVVIEENKEFHQIIGSPEAPYINQLAARGALMEQSFGIAHPSLPNYLALFSGSTHDVKNDACSYALEGPNLAEALRKAGLGFAIFSETMPETGFAGCSSHAYRKKHNPVAYFASLPPEINRRFEDFPADFSKLPSVAFVVPDEQNDMHDGSIAQGDAWLREHIEPYVRWAPAHRSLLILTWDEDDFAHDNQIATILVGAGVKVGRYAQRIDHYSVLRTLADFYGVPPPGQAAEAQPIAGIWSGGADAKAP
jgi:phosphatidylinositol-3-phosphatase